MCFLFFPKKFRSSKTHIVTLAGQKSKLNFVDFLGEDDLCSGKQEGFLRIPPDRYVPNSSPAIELRSAEVRLRSLSVCMLLLSGQGFQMATPESESNLDLGQHAVIVRPKPVFFRHFICLSGHRPEIDFLQAAHTCHSLTNETALLQAACTTCNSLAFPLKILSTCCKHGLVAQLQEHE